LRQTEEMVWKSVCLACKLVGIHKISRHYQLYKIFNHTRSYKRHKIYQKIKHLMSLLHQHRPSNIKWNQSSIFQATKPIEKTLTTLYKLQKETTHNKACRNHHQQHLHYFRQQYPYKARQTDCDRQKKADGINALTYRKIKHVLHTYTYKNSRIKMWTTKQMPHKIYELNSLKQSITAHRNTSRKTPSSIVSKGAETGQS